MTGGRRAAADQAEACIGHLFVVVVVVVVRSLCTQVLALAAHPSRRHWACSWEACVLGAACQVGLAGEAGGRSRALRASRPH